MPAAGRRTCRAATRAGRRRDATLRRAAAGSACPVGCAAGPASASASAGGAAPRAPRRCRGRPRARPRARPADARPERARRRGWAAARSGDGRRCGRTTRRRRRQAGVGDDAGGAHDAVRRLGRGAARRGRFGRAGGRGVGGGRRRLRLGARLLGGRPSSPARAAGSGSSTIGSRRRPFGVGETADAVGRRVVDARRVALDADLELVRRARAPPGSRRRALSPARRPGSSSWPRPLPLSRVRRRRRSRRVGPAAAVSRSWLQFRA